jgi:cytochrome c2
VSSKRLRVAVPVAIAVALVAAVTAFAATHAQRATSTTTKLTAALKGAGATGTLTASVTASATTGTLTWKLTLKPAAAAKLAAVRAGTTAAGKQLVKLCGPCAAGAHGTAKVSGATLTSIVGGHTGVAVTTTKGTLRGALKKQATTPPPTGTLNVVVTPALVAKGKAAAETYSCTGCHTIDGTKSTGPTWKGLAGSNQHLTNGKTIVATDSYLLSVIEDPSTLMVQGYDSGIMAEAIPAGSVPNSEAIAIIAYIKSVK